MRREWRIPTILGILIIGLSLTATVFLFRNARNFFGQATADITPQEVKITNISDSSFSVSWITPGDTNGTINFGENSSLGNVAIDDRDQITGNTEQYKTHHITLRYLKPNTQYYFKIISGGTTFDNNGENYIVSTAPQITPSASQAQPAYGTILKADGTPAAGAIVYLNLANSTILSTLVKSSGNWLITLNNARTADLGSFLSPKGTDTIEIFVQGDQETSQVVTTVSKDAPVMQITLGKTYNFSQGAGTTSPSIPPSASATPSSSPGAKFSLPAVATPSPSLATPATDAAIPSDRPVFKGTGVPGATVAIKIESPATVNGTTSVDQNGNWTWTPPTGLAPGEHTVTITTKDSSGKLALLTRKFTVLASGTQVNEPATPSASPRVSPSPSVRPTPSLSPSPKATTSPTPTSGDVTPTFLLIVLGLTFMALGTGRILLLHPEQS